MENTDWGYVAKLGPLYYGQSRDIIVPMNIPSDYAPYLEVTVELDRMSGGSPHKITVEGSSRISTPNAVAAFVRNHVVDVVSSVVEDCEGGRGMDGIQKMRVLVGKVAGYEAVNDAGEKDSRINGLNEDISGRISKAVSTVERFKRWGQHYLRAVTRAHQVQVCTNYMDPGLQCYGGTLFKQIQDIGGKSFLILPLKKKEDYYKLVGRTMPNGTTGSTYSASPIPISTGSSTTTYYAGSGGGCFDGSCTVLVSQTSGITSDEIPKLVSQVKKNDYVHVVDVNGTHSSARVLCVVQIKRNMPHDDLIEFKNSGLKITRKHPIRVGGQWGLPVDFMNGVEVSTCPSTSDYVYNFILDRCHILLVNGMECVTFGHGIQGPVTWHPFYASREVVDVVSSLQGFEEGFVSTCGSLRSLLHQKEETPLVKSFGLNQQVVHQLVVVH